MYGVCVFANIKVIGSRISQTFNISQMVAIHWYVYGFFYVTKRTYVRKGPLAMNKNELLEYIDTNSTAITIFKDKIRTEQEAKNNKRQSAKRWNEAKIERVVNKYTDDFIGNVYDKLYKGMKANRNTSSQEWIAFIETNEILDDLEESVSMMEIGED